MNDFKDLLKRYLYGHLNSAEVQELLDHIEQDEQVLPEQITELLAANSAQGTGDPAQEEALFNRVMEKGRRTRTIPLYRRIQWWAAAGVLVLLGAAGYYWQQQQQTTGGGKKSATEQVAMDASQLPAGRKGAILTLSNGDKVSLDSAGNGAIAVQNGVRVALSNGQLLYNADSASAHVVYNILNTPRGREFRLVLPDGTQAWLNSASSIRYPTAFRGQERSVEITGEVYFEVAANANMPFRVKINGSTSVDVLGTHFNINAYTDEKDIVATLAQGAIKFNVNQESTILSPGQQAIVSNFSAGKQHISTHENVDVAQVLAWKDGLFDFNHMPFDQVMRQLSRWYDIDVVYENKIPEIDFEGTLGRDVSLSKILFFLSKVGVQYRLEGRTLVISQ